MQLVWRLVVPVVNLFCDGEPIKLIWSVIFISSFLSSLVSILPPRSKITWVENRKWKAGVCSLLVLSCHFLKRLIVWRLVFVVPSGEQRCHVYLPNVVMTDEDEGHKAAELSFKCQRLSRPSSWEEQHLFILYPKRPSNHNVFTNSCCRPHPESNRPFLSCFLVGQWPLVVALIITAAKEEVSVYV